MDYTMDPAGMSGFVPAGSFGTKSKNHVSRPTGYTKTFAGDHKHLSNEQDKLLMKKAVHTQHKGYDDNAQQILADAGVTQMQHTKTEKKRILVPVEETVEVPVYRQQAVRKTKKVTVQGTRVVPTTRYKEVEETVLKTMIEDVNGRKEKRAMPVTQKRMIPYTHYEEQVVDVQVDVPCDEVAQQIGTRRDKHVVSKVVEIEQDHVYEMRPVLVSKGDKRMKELGDHHSFKKKHGGCDWDTSHMEAWQHRPKTPIGRNDLPRPGTASTVRSVNTTLVMPRLKPEKRYDAPKVPHKSASTPNMMTRTM